MASTPKHELFMRIHLPSLQLARKISCTFLGRYRLLHVMRAEAATAAPYLHHCHRRVFRHRRANLLDGGVGRHDDASRAAVDVTHKHVEPRGSGTWGGRTTPSPPPHAKPPHRSVPHHDEPCIRKEHDHCGSHPQPRRGHLQARLASPCWALRQALTRGGDAKSEIRKDRGERGSRVRLGRAHPPIKGGHDRQDSRSRTTTLSPKQGLVSSGHHDPLQR